MRIEFIGGGLGLLLSIFVGAFRYVNLPLPQRLEEGLGSVVFTLVLMLPYMVALSSVRLPERSRWAFLLPSTILSFASWGISITGTGIIFLPIAIILMVATIQSLKNKPSPRLGLVLPTIVTLIIMVLGLSSFYLLFSHPDPRSWEFITYSDGRTVWNSVPPTMNGKTFGPFSSDVVSSGGTNTSDIITNVEASRTLGFLLCTAIILTITSRFIPKSPTPSLQSSSEVSE